MRGLKLLAVATIVTLLLHPLSGLSAQHTGDPVVPRGEWHIQLQPSASLLEGLYDPDGEGTLDLAPGFFLPEIGVDQVPGLEPTETRFRSLAGGNSDVGLRIGATRGRVTGDEQVLPVGISYGLLDRVTVGVTVPFVRRRVDTLLRYVPDGANVGLNPARVDREPVDAFLIQALEALDNLADAVDEACTDLGEDSQPCLDGNSLLEGTQGFVGSLELAYEEEALFPLGGSELGEGIANRWTTLRTEMADWEAAAPEAPPLAADFLDSSAFRSLVVNPAWPGSGFPQDTPPAFLDLGDVELHLAVRILPLDDAGERDGTVSFSSAVAGAVRFATGSADSLRAVAPRDPPRGVPGVEIRWISDVILPRRLGVRGTVEVGWHGSRDILLLAPDSDGAFLPDRTRTSVRWDPGTHVGIEVTPRLRIGPGLSLGAGWRMLRREADTFSALHTDGTPPPAPSAAAVVHRLSIEFRYSAIHPPLSDTVSRPFEVLVRGTRSVSGSGDWAPVDRRIDVGARFRLHR